MVFIALIAFVAPVTVQYRCGLTNINIDTGFIQLVLRLSARINKSFPIHYVTTQSWSLLIYTAGQYILVPGLLLTTMSAFCSVSTFQNNALLV
jgi:hypothetical protein